MTTETERAKQLAEDHLSWVAGYNKALGLTMIPMAAAEYLYRTAIYHGVGHGIELERKGEFRPRIGDPLPPEEVERISGEHRLCTSCAHGICEALLVERCDETGQCDRYVAPSLCESCSKRNNCPLDSPNAVKQCGQYVSSLRERIAEAKEPQALDFKLPTIAICCTPAQILEKFKEEVKEYEDAAPGSMAQLIEAWDVIQVAQTYREHGGCSHNVETGAVVCNLQDWHGAGRPVMQAKRAMMIKNAARAMYSDKDNAAILADL
jgi:hypothetical protein